MGDHGTEASQMTERDRLIFSIKERWYHFVELAGGDYRDSRNRSRYGEMPNIGDSRTAWWTMEMMRPDDDE